MLRRRLRQSAEKNQLTERWLVSYADYMTIMFAFFVVMYAIAINKEESFQILSDSLEQVFDKSARKAKGYLLTVLPQSKSYCMVRAFKNRSLAQSC